MISTEQSVPAESRSSVRESEGRVLRLAGYNLESALRRRGRIDPGSLLREHARSAFVLQPGWVRYALEDLIDPEDHDLLVADMACARLNLNLGRYEATGEMRVNGIVHSGKQTVAQVMWYLSMIHDPAIARRAAGAVGDVLQFRVNGTRWGGNPSEWTQDDLDYHAKHDGVKGEDLAAFNSLWPYIATRTDEDRIRNRTLIALVGADEYLREFEAVKAMSGDLDSYVEEIWT